MRAQAPASHAAARPPQPAAAQPPGAAPAPGPWSAAPAADPHLAAGVALMEQAEWGLAGGRFGDALRAGAGSPAAGRAAQYLTAVKMLQARLLSALISYEPKCVMQYTRAETRRNPVELCYQTQRRMPRCQHAV